MAFPSWPGDMLHSLLTAALAMPAPLLLLLLIGLGLTSIAAAYLILLLIAPKPRLPFPSEKTYLTSSPDGPAPTAGTLPCWYDRWLSERQLALTRSLAAQQIDGADALDDDDMGAIEPAEVEMTVVVPAFNEEQRIVPALHDMVEYCDARFGRPGHNPPTTTPHLSAPLLSPGAPASPALSLSPSPSPGLPGLPPRPRSRHGYKQRAPAAAAGYEILVVSDESADDTVGVVLAFARERGLHDTVRVVRLERNRGKGGAVTHAFRHARGAYVVFADADGASRFSDLGKLMEGCNDVVDGSDRGVAIGSRAHLVGSEAVVKACCVSRSAIRNFLMRSFHFLLMILTPPATSRIRDTQCGFKLFSRGSLPYIIPYMHSEGWIFDIEMLMLAESAPATPVLGSDGETIIGSSPGIRVAEVPVGWHEVGGSKMKLVEDSIRMALGLAVLRASWMLGVYRRRLT